MKKILIIMDCMLPVPAVRGGAVSTLIENLLKVNERKNEVIFYIFTLTDEKSEKTFKEYKRTNFIPIYQKPYIKFLDKFVSQKKYLWKLYVIRKARKYLRLNDFDAVVLQNNGYLLKIFKNKKLMNKNRGKIFYHLHNDIPSNVDKEIVKQCKIILISKYLEKKITNLCGNNIKNNCIVVKNGIDIQQFNKRLTFEEKLELRKKYGINCQQKVLVFVGRINPQKGINELLEAIKLLNDTSVVLLVIGSTNFGTNDCSDFEKMIRQKCNDLSSQVCFIGYIKNCELWKFYQIANIAVLPSMWEEPAGLTMLEAVASGTPIITTLSGGIPEYISNDCGLMLNRDGKIVASIANAINEILLNEDHFKKNVLAYQDVISSDFSEEAFYNRFIDCVKNDKVKYYYTSF